MKQKTDLGEVIKMKVAHGMSWSQISKHTGVPKSTLIRQFQNVVSMLNPDNLDAYRTARAQVLTGLEAEVVRQMADPDRLKKASLNNLAYAFYQVNNARLLAEGKATQNIDMRQTLLSLQADAEKVRRTLEYLDKSGA